MGGVAQNTSSTLSETGLMAAAEAATDLHDWGSDQSFRIGLGKLIAAVNELSAPAPFVNQVRERVLASLITKLRFVEDARLHPEVLAEKIQRPVIIVGLPRTGTTVLYDLLALDQGARTPRDWEFSIPWPAPEVATWTTDPRIAQVNGLYAHLLQAAPALADIQILEATHPSECNLAFTHHFASSQFPAEWGVPSYARWLRENSPPGRYAAHQRLLQQLQWKGPRGRWTLKSPEHLCTIEELLIAYPDAALIWTHRDPVSAFSSLSSMINELVRAFGAPENPTAVGRYVVDTWATALEHATGVRERNPAVERAIIDIAHRDVIKDKFEVVRRIYDRFGLPFTSEYEARLHANAAKVSARLGRHKHRPEDFGIDAKEVRARLPRYLERFGALFD